MCYTLQANYVPNFKLEIWSNRVMGMSEMSGDSKNTYVELD